MAEEAGCVFFFFGRGSRFVTQHSGVKALRTTQLAEGTRNSSYRPQKFIISKGTADDKISRKFETLQRKLHVSQKQYLGQNESDKCVTWVGITLWIYQSVTVQFLLIVQTHQCFCCRWCKKKKSFSSELYTVDLETTSQEPGWSHHCSLYNGELVPINSRKGPNRIEPGSFLASPAWRSRPRTWNRAAAADEGFVPTSANHGVPCQLRDK